jgi:hypothetical protein
MQIKQSTIDIISSQIVAEQVGRLGSATAECFAGMDLLKDVAKQYIKCDPEITQGRLFEIIESTKFNINAAKAGEMFRAFTTHSLGDPQAAADIVIKDSFHILKAIQAKSGKSASSLARMIADPKYGEMDRLVNSEKASRVAELVKNRAQSNSIYAKDYQQAHPHITGELNYGDISSGGTSYEEALRAAVNPDRYALEQKIRHFVTNTYSAIVNGALAGAFVGMGTGLLQGSIQLVSGEKDVGSVAKSIGKSTIYSASRNAVISGIAHGIKFIGKDSALMRGNVATALASSAVAFTELTYKFTKGQITIEDYLKSIGENAVSTFSGIVLSAAGGFLFGPVGAAAAATVGMIGMKQLYQSFLSVQQDIRLAKEERERAEYLSELLIQQLKEEEQQVINFYREASEIVIDLSHLVEAAIHDDSKVAYSISQLASKLNVFIKYETKDKFDEFMFGDEPLIL